MSTTKSECCEKSQFNPCDCTCHLVEGWVEKFDKEFGVSEEWTRGGELAEPLKKFIRSTHQEERNTLIDELVEATDGLKVVDKETQKELSHEDSCCNETLDTVLSLLQSKKK